MGKIMFILEMERLLIKTVVYMTSIMENIISAEEREYLLKNMVGLKKKNENDNA